MSAPIRLKDPSVSGKQYTFCLGFGGLAALVTGLALALSLFFVLGVLVGRGHRPETAVPVVAGIMPRETAPAPPAPAQAQEVLKPEELSYTEQLARKHEGPTPSRSIDADGPRPKPAAKQEANPAVQPATKPEAKPVAKPADASARKPEEGAVNRLAEAAVAKAKTADKKAAPDPDTTRYDYAYQTATFPDEAPARAHLKRIKALGLKGDVESGQTDGKEWHRVVVFFQGAPTDTRGLKAKLATIGVQKPVMRSKVPAQ